MPGRAGRARAGGCEVQAGADRVSLPGPPGRCRATIAVGPPCELVAAQCVAQAPGGRQNCRPVAGGGE
eukprot:1888403-Alexandrium_andersonii.AAC.1